MSEARGFLSVLTGSLATPAAENPTVAMIEAAYRHHGLDARYVNCDVPPHALGDAVRGARAMGWVGFNCSIPHKVAVVAHLDGLGESAAIVGAASLTIVNRDPERGAGLVELVNEKTPARADLAVWDAPYRLPATTSIVVNATSIGLFPHVEGRLNIELGSLEPHMVVADVIPNPPRTALIRDAQARGCVTLDGLGMLVNQAIISINHWTGVDADPKVMRQKLEELFPS